MSPVPEKTTVLVVGGGPAGSYSASVLARHGIDVTILEGAKFPRYHIGESLLASTNYFLEYIGAREKVMAHGFVKKPGASFKLRRDFPRMSHLMNYMICLLNFCSPFMSSSGVHELCPFSALFLFEYLT
jgi:flavin-dependent dehydrogenase